MGDINLMSAGSGRYVSEDGQVFNLVDLLGAGAEAVPGMIRNVDAYAPRSGRFIGEDGKVHNIIDLIAAKQAAINAQISGAIEPVNMQLAAIAPRPRITRTLTEAVNAVTFSTGDDGQALNGKNGRLHIIVPAGCDAPVGTTAVPYLRINDIATGYARPSNAVDNSTEMQLGGIRNRYGMIDAHLSVVGSALLMQAAHGYSDGTTRNSNVYVGALLSGVGAITKLYLWLSNGYTLPVGTFITYEEVAA